MTLLIAGSIAGAAGAAAGALAEPARSGRSAIVAVGYIAILMLAYVLVAQTASRYTPPGSHGGPNVMPPLPDGAHMPRS